jgi:hypothetical protein
VGWNQGFRIFEHTVINSYDLGKLDKPLLGVLMEPYRGTDIDEGGSRGLITNDGLTVLEVVLKVNGVKLPTKPTIDDNNNSEWENYYEKLYGKFNKITKNFGW